jgi:hypothetical protein
MLKKISIFVLLFLLPQEETEGASYKESMLISDALPVQFWPEGCDTYNESENYGIHPICWLQPLTCSDEIKIQFQDEEATALNFTEYSLRILSEDGDTLETLEISYSELAANGLLHTVTFSPLDYDICDQRIKLEIWSQASPDARVLRTDLLDVKETHSGTKLISYSNQRNFAGLYYEGASPDTVFYIRVRCRFFHEEIPQTDEAMELTSSVLTTSSQKKNQKLLEVEHAPYYIHNKIIEVVQHQTLTIDNNTWKKEEGYDINPGTKNWPLKTATCLLTRTNSVIRNVI